MPGQCSPAVNADDTVTRQRTAFEGHRSRGWEHALPCLQPCTAPGQPVGTAEGQGHIGRHTDRRGWGSAEAGDMAKAQSVPGATLRSGQSELRAQEGAEGRGRGQAGPKQGSTKLCCLLVLLITGLRKGTQVSGGQTGLRTGRSSARPWSIKMA